MRKLIGVVATVGGCAVLCPSAVAVTAPSYAVRPMKLPGLGARAAKVEPGRWLVGARPGAGVARVAKRYGARSLAVPGRSRVSRTTPVASPPR